jgi:hypothetical protein
MFPLTPALSQVERGKIYTSVTFHSSFRRITVVYSPTMKTNNTKERNVWIWPWHALSVVSGGGTVPGVCEGVQRNFESNGRMK